MKRLRLAFATCAFSLLAGPAHASLVNHGNGSFTDTSTGWLWRTLGQYDGLDFSSAAGSLPLGYHVASEGELATLAAAAPADPAIFATDAAAMGVASSASLIWGFYGDGTRYAWRDSLDTAWNSSAVNAQGWTAWNYAVDTHDAFDGLSLFAVDTSPTPASPVPEPATPALLTFGLIGLYRLRRRR